MPKRNHHAAPHKRTRKDHESETAEDYVEAVAEIAAERGKCRVVDLARKFAVSHVTVTKTVSRLKEAGLMASEPYGPIELTERGRRMARESQQRHEIVYAFLRSIGVSEAVAANDAEGMEHHVSKETLQRFQEIVQQQSL